jgi:hypothetical protein
METLENLGIKKDFSYLNELENRIIPIIKKLDWDADKRNLEAYIRRIFDNQWKK